jgi:hypothetical protein
MQYFDNDDDDKKQKRPAKAAASETEDGGWFRKYFTENYATHGERRRVILRSSREIVYALRNTYPLTEEEVTIYMQQLGYSAVTIDGEPLWRIYELEDIEL